MATCKASAAPNLTEPEAEAEPDTARDPWDPWGTPERWAVGFMEDISYS